MGKSKVFRRQMILEGKKIKKYKVNYFHSLNSSEIITEQYL